MQPKVVYFSAEFGIQESLPVYSGGLGVLAGDYIKASAELDYPVVGIGILYRRGYFHQSILTDGRQVASYPELNPEDIPGLQLVTDEQGKPVYVDVRIESRKVYLKVWKVAISKVQVYLLDADVELNQPQDRRLTDRLYGGNSEERLCHEIILGIGGVRALRKLGVEPSVWHMNEGHAAFCALERIREFSALGIPFHVAVEGVRATTVFTTHTPVAAGHDVFSFSLIDKYLGELYWQLGADRSSVLSLGQVGGAFNMTRLAVNTSSKVNGVSRLHAQVTREIFHRWTPSIPKQDIAVESVTNGVHTHSWVAPELRSLFDTHLETGWASRVDDESVWAEVASIPDHELWNAHHEAKRRMIEYLGLPIHEDALVIGFARRFATYKRATLVLSDLERLDRILNGFSRPVCLVFSGKAHPNDGPGQELIRRIVDVSQSRQFKDRIFIVENYHLGIAKHLVQGADVWLNTPIRPMEASGTSGQKAGLNAVLNCSVLDGWWCESYNAHNGWAIDGAMREDVTERDAQDSAALYRILEEEVVPLYFERDASGLPSGWIRMMKASIHSVAPRYSAHRMVKEYWDKIYGPTIERGHRFLANEMEVARRVADFKQFMRREWPHVRVIAVSVQPWVQQSDAVNPGMSTVETRIFLGAVWEHDVRVEAVGSDGAGGIWRLLLQHDETLEDGVHLYRGNIAMSPHEWRQKDANVRVLPVSDEFANLFELELSTWGQ